MAVGVIGLGFMIAAAAVSSRVRLVRVEGAAPANAAIAPPYPPR